MMQEGSASAFMELLRQRCRNSQIDWETVLEVSYMTLLVGLPAPGVLDIGGHSGRHAKIFTSVLHAGHVVVFEPLPPLAAALEKEFLLCANVKVVACALSNWRGATTFVVKTSAPEESGLRARLSYNDGAEGDLQEIKVRVETLDDFSIPFKVDFIKIDTEGGEVDILKGAAKLLRRDQPIVSVEYGPSGFGAYGHTAETLYDLADDQGYDLYDLFGNRFASREEWSACVGRFYWDYLMIPRGRAAALANRIAALRAGAASLSGAA